MTIWTKTKRTLLFGLAAGALAYLPACSKNPPPSQPPVVINVNSGAATASASHAKEKPQSMAQDNQGQRQAYNAGGQITNAAAQPNVTSTLNTSEPTYMQQAPVYEPRQPAILDEASFLNTQIHEIAQQLLRNFRDESGPSGPVAVATFVDLNNLYRTSPFGRYIAEQLMGELQRAGFNVVEIRKADSIMVKPKYGEYGLSREIQELARQSSARYILAGTYVTKGRYILINARLISNENNLVASSGLKILRKDPFLERMLWPSASPATVPVVRVPVKELGSLSEMKILSGS